MKREYEINPHTVTLENEFTKDMTNIGHYGTGNLRVIVKNIEDFQKAKSLLDKAYDEV